MAIAIDEGVCDHSFDDGCTRFNIYLPVGLEFLLLILLVFSLAGVLGGGAARKAARAAQSRYAPLLQSGKDWFVRGDITEAEFERIRSTIEPLLSGKGDEIRIRRAAGILTWAAGLSSGASFILVPVTIGMFADATDGYSGPEEFAIAVTFAFGSLAMMVVAITCWVLMARFRGGARTTTRATEERIRAEEESILRAANERRRGAGIAPKNPSFQSFGRR